MKEGMREHYFILVRMIMLLLLEIYILLFRSAVTGASPQMLLFLALFVGMVAGGEMAEGRRKLWFLQGAGGCVILLWSRLYESSLLLCIFYVYELLHYRKPRWWWYLLPVGLTLCAGEEESLHLFLVSAFMGMLYLQHDLVVAPYQKQSREDSLTEQQLKHNMNRREYEMQEEVKRSALLAKNQLLEERAELSQTLHDKLGHSINGSVYQLEAAKVLLKKEPEASRKMIQAVIDQLREGMDEIRAILRRERPPKDELTLLSLERLCEDCRAKGVKAELVTEGDLKAIPDKCLEVLLDNAYEAVSNSMKYAECSKIDIAVYVLNRMVRCRIADDGVGCKELTDGMGISGMRRRTREINGILDFETENGFVINMLLPIEKVEKKDG